MRLVPLLAAALLAAPASAATVVLDTTFTPTNVGDIGSVGAVFTFASPIELKQGDTLDWTIRFATPLTLSGGSFIWPLAYSPTGGSLDASGTIQFINPSSNLQSGPIAVSQNMSAVHIGNYTVDSQYRIGPGPISFSGIRQILTINNQILDDGTGTGNFAPAPDVLRLYDNGILLTDATVGTSVVPEPETWAMMILGFGVVGLAMRRRSAARTVTA